MVLLLMDLLGVKARWKQGRDAVDTAFADFDGFVRTGLDTASDPASIQGGIDSDAAALRFDDLADAIRVARSTYLAAFGHGNTTGGNRYWIRGVVVPCDDEPLRTRQSLAAPFDHLARTKHASPLLDAIAVEQSGELKGMRLLVASSLVNASLRQEFRVDIEGKWLHPFSKLKFSQYPKDQSDHEWCDFLWMATNDRDEWSKRCLLIRDRMRRSADDPGEFPQSSATRLVFDECRAILAKLHADWA